MHRQRPLVIAMLALGGAPLVAGCAVVPPTEPSVMALPPAGKSLTAFQQEDAQCRTYASAAMGGKTAPASSQDLQTRYDILYTQFMYSHGNSILGARSFGAGYPAYAGMYPSFWWEPGFYPWYPGGVFGSSIIVFGRRPFFHHRSHTGFAGTFHPGGCSATIWMRGQRQSG